MIQNPEKRALHLMSGLILENFEVAQSVGSENHMRSITELCEELGLQKRIGNVVIREMLDHMCPSYDQTRGKRRDGRHKLSLHGSLVKI